jgi:mycothiol synthase
MSTTITIRPARKDDLVATAEILNEHARTLYGMDDMVPADLLQYWESPDVEFPADVLVAESSGGAISGYADVGLHGDHVWLDVRATAPDSLPGLLEAIEKRAAEKKPDAKLMGYTSDADAPLRELYEKAGYSLVRHSFRMQIELDEDPQEPEWPDGYTARRMRDAEECRFYDAQMASFADTWMFSPEPYDVWRHWMVDEPSFDSSLWFLAEKGDELGGIVIARAPENEPGVGWVRILGVIPEHRQQGLAQALLRHTFREFASRGFNAVALGVDAENPTGAVRVYERAGMHVERTNLMYEKHQR